jgi:hypothetical protein
VTPVKSQNQLIKLPIILFIRPSQIENTDVMLKINMKQAFKCDGIADYNLISIIVKKEDEWFDEDRPCRFFFLNSTT